MSREHEKQNEESITFRSEMELEPCRYVQVRCDFLCSQYFTPGAKVLYMLLCYHVGPVTSSWSSYPLLARECGMKEAELEDALQLLAEARLITAMHAGESRQRVYVLHALPKILPIDSLHIPQEPTKINNEHIERDNQLLITRVGINEAVARRLALLAAERGSSEGYVADVIEYALSTPSIKNPAGCVVELIRRNETRKRASQVPLQEKSQGLDAEKYTKGKYAFLFRPLSEPTGTQRDEQEESHEQLGRGAADDKHVGEQQL
jgi:hypothetical protein